MTKLGLMFKNIENENKAKYNSFYTNSNAEIIINESDINDVFELIYTTIISNIQKSLGKGLDWIIYSVIDHNISILKYNALAGRSYIRLKNQTIQEGNWLIFKILMIMNVLNGVWSDTYIL